MKQKIRLTDDEFNWKDGENHWENFLKYKEVFGDVELEVKDKRLGDDVQNFINSSNGCDDLGLGFGLNSDDLEEDDGELGEDGGSDGELGADREGDDNDSGFPREKRLKMDFYGDLGRSKRLGFVGSRVLELRDILLRREERRREREFTEERKKDTEKWVDEREKGLESREMELEEMQIMWARREFEKRLRLEREFDEERRWRMKVEEQSEEEEMQWREKMVIMQIEHEKQMMQMHADACQNQMQILSAMARLVCQFFGSANDGLGGGLAALPAQVLQNLQHTGGLEDSGKPDDAHLPSEFL